MKVCIKGKGFKLAHTVKDEKGVFSLHLLTREESKGHYALSIFPDHYRLYPPLGNSLPVTREPLKDIVFGITERKGGHMDI